MAGKEIETVNHIYGVSKAWWELYTSDDLTDDQRKIVTEVAMHRLDQIFKAYQEDRDV